LAFDLETHLIQQGLLAPPIVCGSYADQNSSGLLTPAEIIAIVEEHLRNGLMVAGANISYDFGCILAVRPDLLPLIWTAYEEERVFDVLIAGTLDAIYDGRLTDGELFNKKGKKIQSGRYSLESVTEDYLGRTDAKKNDVWRKSYALLDGTPIAQWPEEARQYPLDDAQNTLDVAKKQLQVCHNLHNLAAQAHAAFCAHLGAIWGLRVDPERVATLKTTVDAEIKKAQEFAIANKLLKVGGTRKEPKWTKDTKFIKELVFCHPPRTRATSASAAKRSRILETRCSKSSPKSPSGRSFVRMPTRFRSLATSP
jgi:hypothetical protein